MIQTIAEKIQQRRYQMLVHSYIYYHLNDNIISDYDFDKWAKELVEMTEKYPKEASEVVFHKEFEGFDGSTGVNLPLDMPWIHDKSIQLIKYHKKK
ncbi:hypothetical protein CN514_07660 [Bacillus sp. AFS001701]|uniref:DNA ligase LigA-related protein n=1 Tax=Bacillus sp. AFS001701 TaxID=2033480 RepID=UPI000BF3B121|nr:hypothetical protein [Bacillus sp. AFS001701]PET71265.1 hypothetical protein CN514_07660 [Bacillus sp. AFS001701]